MASKPETKRRPEVRQHRDLLRKLTPKKKVHQDYLKEAVRFIEELSALADVVVEQVPIWDLNVVGSQLFERQYLVMYVDAEWFGRAAPGCDAAAFPGMEFGPIHSPPLVMAPATKVRCKTVAYRSTLEHEFVHVNQALLGQFPDIETLRKQPIQYLLEFTQAEYQANFLQLHRWPTLFALPKKNGISLQYWCALRGYTQALEKVVTAVICGALSKAQVNDFLKKLPKHLPVGFRKIGIDPSLGNEFAADLPRHLGIAITQMINGGLAPNDSRGGFSSLISWIERQGL